MNHIYMPQCVGGSECSTHDLCIYLLRQCVPVAVLAALQPGDLVWVRNRLSAKLSNQKKIPRDQILGYPVYRGWHPSEGVQEVIREFQPDVAIMQFGEPMKLAYKFLEAGIPSVVYLRVVDFDHLGGSITPRQAGLRFIANSGFIADKFECEFGIKPEVIPPLVNPDRYRVESTRQSVVFINPKKVKGLEIAFHLAERRPDIPFEFIESWSLNNSDWSELKRRARQLGNVKIRRRVSDMRPIYGNAKILLAPSISNEAWGRVVTEAQISAIPVLASNFGGLPESVGPGGILVNPDSHVSEWVNALSSLWNDTAEYERLSRAALEYSLRPEIQPSFLASKFLSLISDHLDRSRDLKSAH